MRQLRCRSNLDPIHVSHQRLAFLSAARLICRVSRGFTPSPFQLPTRWSSFLDHPRRLDVILAYGRLRVGPRRDGVNKSAVVKDERARAADIAIEGRFIEISCFSGHGPNGIDATRTHNLRIKSPLLYH